MTPSAKVNVYKRAAVPEELTRSVFRSIRLYLQEYKDTSKPKEERKRSIESAYVITEWVIGEIVKHIDSFEKDLVYYGFCKVFESISQAKADFTKVYDVSESIGFVKILEG